MYPVRWIRAQTFLRAMEREKQVYEELQSAEAIRCWQLEQLNLQWRSVVNQVPFFQRKRRQNQLPAQFSSWDEFRTRLPIMDRRILQTHRDSLTDSSCRARHWRTTGGSTGEPIQLPVSDHEVSLAKVDLWLARSWFGIDPADKLFMIWGHAHLLGSGLRARINGIRRKVKDQLLGYLRHSAYDLSERGLRYAGQRMLEFQPRYILGYSVALDRFARVNEHRSRDLQKLGLKAVIATAESFPRPDSAELVAGVFGCPVVMEYGAVETGPIAHQKPDGWYFPFWRRYFLEVTESAVCPEKYELLVTSLFRRSLPLVRYKIGDLVSDDLNASDSTPRFRTVVGRCNDFVRLPDGATIHSEAFAHVIRDFDFISEYQVDQSLDGAVTIHYVANGQVPSRMKGELKARLRRVHPALDGAIVSRVGSLERTLAGKAKRVRRAAWQTSD